VRLTAFVDSATPVPLLHGLSRSDVTGIFTGLRDATTSRFAGYCVVSADLPQPACLRIFAELDNGAIELAFAQRFRPQTTTGAVTGLPRLSRWTFWRASRALAAAARRGGWPLGDAEQFSEARRLTWENYSAGAPRTFARGVQPDDPAPAPHRPLQITLVSQNLNREGAPLIAFEFAGQLAAQPDWRVLIVSPEDGPLHESFVAAGLPVTLLNLQPLFAAENQADFDREIALLASGEAWQGSDVIVANTMVAFWAVHLARHLRKPSLFYVHESASVRHFFVPFSIPGLLPRIEEAFGLATRTVFSATATCVVHAALERQANFRIMPGWIDVGRILAYSSAHSPADLRRVHGLPADAVIFSNIGSITERKGQHVFVEAVDLLLRAGAARGEALPPLVFLMVGSSPTFYLDLLRHEIARRQLACMQVVEHVADAHAFFRLSDIFVCSSFEEAFPRVVLEAAAFRLPVVSTDVNGIPEMLGPDDAWFVPPGDPALLAVAMQAALAAHLAGDTSRAERGHRAVCSRFDSATLLPRHAALVASVADLPVR